MWQSGSQAKPWVQELPGEEPQGGTMHARLRCRHEPETMLMQKSVASLEDLHWQWLYKGSAVGKLQKLGENKHL